jgi:hypothetical protein
MAEDWPSPHHHESHPLPRVEDLPAAWEGYDRERVQAAFDAFYRHIARLDATLRTPESVEVFRGEAGDLRAELRSLRAAGWSPYPRGYTLTPERSMLGSVPEAVPRIALEVVFLVIVAAVVAVAKLSALEIVGIMAGAVLIAFLVELIAARDRRVATPIPAAAPVAPASAPRKPVEVVQRDRAVVTQESKDEAVPAPVASAPERVQAPSDQEEEARAADDGSGWAAFAEPAGPQPLMLMGALAAEEEQPAQERSEPVEPQPEPAPEEPTEGELEPAAGVTEAETGTIARRRFRRRKHADGAPEPAPEPVPKHVRVLPPPETAVSQTELPPWEQGFDDTEERR